MKIIGCLIVFASMIIATSGYAKCPLIEWKVSGTIKSSSGEVPVEGAQIFVFPNESESTHSLGYATKYPDFFTSHADGSFIATSYFDSFEKRTLFRGDVCSKRPGKIEIIVIKRGFKTKRKIFKDTDISIKEENDMPLIILPAIYLEEPIKEK